MDGPCDICNHVGVEREEDPSGNESLEEAN
jgi:hypothetical protein